MGIGDALTLHGIDAHRCRVEQNVDDMILEQIDLIYIEDVAVRRRQNAWLEFLAPVLNRSLHVERSDHAVLRRADGQLHHTHRNFLCRELFSESPPCTAGITVEIRQRRITVTGTAGHRPQIRQECCSSTDSSGFRRPFLALDQHTAKRRHDNAEKERLLHLLLSDNSCKRINRFCFHVGIPSYV